MNVYTYSEARQNLASILDIAKKEGGVLIKRRDGTMFRLTIDKKSVSPFARVKGIKTDITTQELLTYIRESRSAE